MGKSYKRSEAIETESEIRHSPSSMFGERELKPGDMLRFHSQVGQFQFIQSGWHVKNPNVVWLDCRHPKRGGLRSFDLGDLKSVRTPRKKNA